MDLSMSLGDVIMGALLLVTSGVLVWISVGAFRRHRNRSFLMLAVAFGIFLAEAVAISLFALGMAGPGTFPTTILVGGQVVVLVLVYAATFPAP
jgi:hypothetical protein